MLVPWLPWLPWDLLVGSCWSRMIECSSGKIWFHYEFFFGGGKSGHCRYLGRLSKPCKNVTINMASKGDPPNMTLFHVGDAWFSQINWVVSKEWKWLWYVCRNQHFDLPRNEAIKLAWGKCWCDTGFGGTLFFEFRESQRKNITPSNVVPTNSCVGL